MIQGFTQEEGGPLWTAVCSSENDEEYLSSDDESVQTDIDSSSEDDDEEGDDIQITVRQLLNLGGELLAICFK